MGEPVKPPRIVVFGQGHVTQALADARFFELLPEFRSIQQKAAAQKTELAAHRGCTGCQRRRQVANIFGDFIAIMLGLSPDGLARLKQYYGSPTMMVNSIDPTTRQAQMRVL